MEKKELIGSVKKNTRENILVQVRQFRGGTFVDARVWIQDTKIEGQGIIPTRKGLCLSPEVVRELLPLLAAAAARTVARNPQEPDEGGF